MQEIPRSFSYQSKNAMRTDKIVFDRTDFELMEPSRIRSDGASRNRVLSKRRRITSDGDYISLVESDDEGEASVVQTLYVVPNTRGQMTWQSSMPAYTTKPDTKGSALVLRYVEDVDSDTKLTKLHTMVMRSPFLKDAVRRLFENYPGEPSALMEEPKYAPLFRRFFHQWAKLQHIYGHTTASDSARAGQLAAVFGVLEEEIGGSSMQDIKNRARNGEVTFDSIWAMFPPGCPVIRGQGSSQHLYLVDDGGYFKDGEGRRFFQLKLKDIDHDGSVFGWRKSSNIVTGFDGTMGIDQLPAVPVNLHRDADAIEKAATVRGTRVAELTSEAVAYRSHEGFADTHSMGQRYLSGRVVIDSRSYVQQTASRKRFEKETGAISTSPGRLQALLPKPPNQQKNDSSLEGHTFLSVRDNYNLHPVLSVGEYNLRETVDTPEDRVGSQLLD
ncbi:hypothetical protein AC579_4586 [Pseudocercospora musae]|uniref:DUF7025 domain-containing protein n=1 Tax=Pseudocercospora musae TaxID=113226 RepID=A0A139ITL0_9PEZI|nr:hypothetical protein AC579_4586 [Pseudocercospora musae]KXT18090.1 hypothetical protein AC579_4586 [Pseudocercospora musae]KXT18091.1 hypothetical protein AC579_4586 [Pseudocercospora musae]KXT18092.1 hypothetical protein AC579_4586 [Pseudocercospora musae]